MVFRSSSTTVAVLAVLLAGLSGCSSDTDSQSDGPCNSLVNDGPEVTPNGVTSGTTPAGGVIEDGLYEQTGYDYYADPGAIVAGSAAIYRGMTEFTAGTVQMALSLTQYGDEREDHFTATYSASGTVLTLTYSCPEEGVVERPNFTATPTEVRMFYRIADDHATAEVVFTKR